MTEEQRRFRKEGGLLVLGVAFGVLGGVISGLWSAYFVEWVKSSDPNFNWVITVIVSSIVLVVVMVFLFVWSIRQIKGNTTKTKTESEQSIRKLTVKNGEKQLDVIDMDAETVERILKSWKENVDK